MTGAFLLMLGSMVVLGATAVAGFAWAARNGQFRDMRDGSLVIFDEDEPVGTPTDVVFKRNAKRGSKAVQTSKIENNR
jgi:nitrogen fixation-related uncharacterized protein